MAVPPLVQPMFLSFPTELLGYTKVVGAPPYVQPIFFTFMVLPH